MHPLAVSPWVGVSIAATTRRLGSSVVSLATVEYLIVLHGFISLP